MERSPGTVTCAEDEVAGRGGRRKHGGSSRERAAGRIRDEVAACGSGHANRARLGVDAGVAAALHESEASESPVCSSWNHETTARAPDACARDASAGRLRGMQTRGATAAGDQGRLQRLRCPVHLAERIGVTRQTEGSAFSALVDIM